MMKEVRGSTQKKIYIVRRAFDGFKPGDVFEPTGDKNDKAIVEHYCDIVYNEIKPVKEKPAKK